MERDIARHRYGWWGIARDKYWCLVWWVYYKRQALVSRVVLTLLETCYVVQGGRGNCYRQVIMTLIMSLCKITGT